MWWCEEGGWPVWATILACLFASVALATFVVVVVVLGLQRRQARRHDAAVQLHIRNDLLGPNDAVVIDVSLTARPPRLQGQVNPFPRALRLKVTRRGRGTSRRRRQTAPIVANSTTRSSQTRVTARAARDPPRCALAPASLIKTAVSGSILNFIR